MANDKKVYFYLFITFFIWGSLYVVSKFVLGKVPVVTVSLLRYVIAGAILLLVLKGRKVSPIQRQDYKYLWLIGLVGYSLSMGMQLLGTKLSSASMASLINSLNPIVIMVLAAGILNERLTGKKILCIVLSLIGVYVIVGDPGGAGQWLGIMISIASVILWSLVSVIMRKVTQKYDSIQVTTYGMLIAVVGNAPFAAYELAVTPQVQFDGPVIAALLYMGIACTALAHVLWNKSLSMLEAGNCSLFYPIQPMTAALLGWLFLGEQMNERFIIGSALIMVSVMFSILSDAWLERAARIIKNPWRLAKERE